MVTVPGMMGELLYVFSEVNVWVPIFASGVYAKPERPEHHA